MSSTLPDASHTGRPLRRDAERNRLRILEAATELFTTRGLDVSLDDIARHAGVGIGTVYRRYPDKQVLIKALFESRIDEFVRVLSDASEIEDPWVALETVFTTMLERESCDRGIMDLLLRADDTLTKSQDVHERITELFEALLARGKAAGVIREEVAMGDIAMLHLMMMSMVSATSATEPDLWRRTLALAMTGLRPGAHCSALPGLAPQPHQVDAAMCAWRTAR